MRRNAQIELGSIEKKRNAATHLPHGKSGAGVHEFIENHCVPLKNVYPDKWNVYPFKRAGLQRLLDVVPFEAF